MSTGLRFTLEVDGLPPDAFAVVSFHLTQSLSSLFSLDLSLVSQQFLSLEFAQVLDKMAYLTVWQGDDVQRRVKGVVTWFELGENDKNQMLYSMKVRPPLWRAGLRQNFRITVASTWSLAQGSSNVFINNQPAARKGDKLECSAAIVEGSPDVFIGGEQVTYLDIQPEFPPWQRMILGGITIASYLLPPAGLLGKLGNLAKLGKLGNLLGKSGKLLGAKLGALLGKTGKSLKSIANKVIRWVTDPVDPVTGAYCDERTDFTLGQTLPLTVRSRHRQIKRAVFHCPVHTVTVRPGQQVAVAVIAESFCAGSCPLKAAQFMVLLPLQPH